VSKDNEKAKPSYGFLQEPGNKQQPSVDATDFVILPAFRASPYHVTRLQSPENSISTPNLATQVSCVRSAPRNAIDYNTFNREKWMLQYKEFIPEKIMPLGTELRLSVRSGGEEAVLRQCFEFQPMSIR
jgi:hypothetical protein